MEFAIVFIGLAAAGVFIGICSGLLGIGGGTVMVPLLRLAFGLDAYTATATSLFAMAFTSLSGGVSHVRNGTCYPKLGIALGLGGSITSAFGVYLGSISPTWAIMLAAAAIIIYSAYTMLVKALKMPPGGKGAKASAGPGATARADGGDIRPRGADAEARADGPSPRKADAADSARHATAAGADGGFALTGRKVAQAFGIGMVAGLCAGYVGVGGGFVMVPLMTAWLGVPMKKASGTSTIAIIILAIPGIVGHVLLGHVDYLAGIMLAAGSIPGAAIGANLVRSVNERQLRFIFAAFLAIAGAMLVVNEFAAL